MHVVKSYNNGSVDALPRGSDNMFQINETQRRGTGSG